VATDEDKMIALAAKLLERTAAGKLHWEDTGFEDMFMASMEDASFRLAKEGPEDYSLTVLSPRGRVIAELHRVPPDYENQPVPERLGGTGYPPLRSLYDLARRDALKVDETIDNLLQKLG